ncbi:hypothetical protein HRbin27_00684 [bacterium HR27]|nr:hypothetical protein HRbin27_00684 [bacterium HR27]
MAHEVVEQIELSRAEPEAPLAAPRLPRHRIEHQIGEHQRFLVARRFDTAEERSDARQKLGRRERLDQVIVSPTVQPEHPILDRVAGRQHEDRRPVPRRPQPLHDRKPIQPGQQPVQHHHVRPALADQAQRLVA